MDIEDVIPDVFEKSVDHFVNKTHGDQFQFRKDVSATHVMNAFGRFLTKRHRYVDLQPREAIVSRIVSLHSVKPDDVRESPPKDVIAYLPTDWDAFIGTLPEQVQVLTINIAMGEVQT